MAETHPIGLAETIRVVRSSGRSRDIQCPAHEDRAPSLSVSLSSRDPGRVLVHCHAGCSPDAVVSAAGLTMAALGPTNGAGPIDLDLTYDYVDEHGQLLYQVVRKPGKVFRQRRPDPSRPGEWLWSLDTTRRVLYHLPALLAAVKTRQPVWIVEGEKDVAACESFGLVATCNSGGAGKWKPEYSRSLGGGDVTIVADNDEPGLAHAQQIANSLKATGVRKWRIVRAAAGKDAADHFAAGHGPDDFVQIQGAAPRPAPTPPPPTPPTETALERRLTEGGNADRFVALHGEDVRYVDEASAWYLWDGCRFQRDTRREVAELARVVVTELYAEAAKESDQQRRQRLGDHAKRSDSAHAVRAMLDLSRSSRPVARTMDDFDRQLDAVTVANGTVDLRNGTLRPSDRADQSTRLAPVVYVPGARCPRWEDFLWTVFRERSHLIRYVQKAVGYSLTGDTTEQCLFLLYGSGANGKSTFLETVRLMLGDYGHTARTETVLLSQGGDRSSTPRPELLDLRGRRMVTASEVVEGKHFNEALVKSMTGGEELNARGMYASSATTFRPTHKLWIGVNHLPIIKGEEEAIWRRIRVIPFDYTVPADQRDPGLPDALRAEWPGILAWAVQGCLAWRRERLGEPPVEVQNATRAYREDSDILADFLSERCLVEPNARVTGQLVYAAYKSWATEQGLRPLAGKAFASKLNARGFVARKTNGVMVYVGLGVTKTAQPDDTSDAALWGNRA